MGLYIRSFTQPIRNPSPYIHFNKNPKSYNHFFLLLLPRRNHFSSASTILSDATILSVLIILRLRLPFVGEFCMLSFEITNFYTPSYSSALKTWFVQYLLRYFMHIYLTLFITLSVCWITYVISNPNWVAGFHLSPSV